MDRLLTVLNARLRRFAESGDSAVVLDPTALDEAKTLWEAVQASDNAPIKAAVIVDVLTVLAYLHWARYQVLPQGQDYPDLQAALSFFRILAECAPERIPGQIQSLLVFQSDKIVGDTERLMNEGLRAYDNYMRTRRPETLEAAGKSLPSCSCHHPTRRPKPSWPAGQLKHFSACSV